MRGERSVSPNRPDEHMRLSATHLDWRGAALTALGAWLCLLPKVLIGLHWHDTSEFIASGRALSLAHPPGHPLTLLAIHLSQLLPWSDAAHRAHLASSFWGGLGVGLSYLGFQLLLMHRSSTRCTLGLRLTCILGALSMILLPLVELQLIRAEVYASQWALTIWVWVALFFAARTQDLRGLLIAALGLGLLAANHTLLTVALIIALLPRLVTWRLSLRVWWMSSVVFLIGASLYVYVGLRGRHGGVSGWGWIDGVSAWWHHVSAKVWQTQVGQRADEVNWGDNLIGMLSFAQEQVGPICALICLSALVLGAVTWANRVIKGFRALDLSEGHFSDLSEASTGRSEDRLEETHSDLEATHARAIHRRPVLTSNWGATLTLATVSIIFTKFTYPFSAQNPDFSGYLASGAPSVLFLLAWVGRHLGRHGALVLLSLVLFGANLQRQHSRPPESMGAEAWGRQMTSEVPSGGTLWSSFYATYFITSALWITEGWRADVRLVFRGHRATKWATRRSKMIPALNPIAELATPQALEVTGARHEVERSLDLAPWLWSRLSVPGSARGTLTSDVLPPDKAQLTQNELQVSRIALTRQTQRLLELGDARQETRMTSQMDVEASRQFLCDEDSAYAWALHHEMNIRWLEMRASNTSQYEVRQRLLSAQEAHRALRQWWIEQIALDRWNQLHFSWSHP